MKKLNTIFPGSGKWLIAVMFLAGCVQPVQPEQQERKVKKLGRLVAVMKDSSRAVIGTFK